MTESMMLQAFVAVIALAAGYLVARVQTGKQLSLLDAEQGRAKALEAEAMRQVAGRTAELKALQDRYNLQEESLRRLESMQAVAEHEKEQLQLTRQQLDDMQIKVDNSQRAMAQQGNMLSAARAELESVKGHDEGRQQRVRGA